MREEGSPDTDESRGETGNGIIRNGTSISARDVFRSDERDYRGFCNRLAPGITVAGDGGRKTPRGSLNKTLL